MSKPYVIRNIKGAIATIVVYLRGKQKAPSDLKSKVINMAEKGNNGKGEDKPKKRSGPNKPND